MKNSRYYFRDTGLVLSILIAGACTFGLVTQFVPLDNCLGKNEKGVVDRVSTRDGFLFTTLVIRGKNRVCKKPLRDMVIPYEIDQPITSDNHLIKG